MSDIDELKTAIRNLHGVESTHCKSVPIKETWLGETIWDGVVEVFDLRGHPQSHRAYAWSRDTDDPEHPRRHVTVLHVPPATSPKIAVQIAIVQEFKAHTDDEI